MSDSPTHYTQVPEQIDYAILKELENVFGEKDKITCENELIQVYQNSDNQLNHIRFSLHVIAKHDYTDFPESSLVRRVNRGGQSVSQKYAADIYLLYNYMKGSDPGHVVQNERVVEVKVL